MLLTDSVGPTLLDVVDQQCWANIVVCCWSTVLAAFARVLTLHIHHIQFTFLSTERSAAELALAIVLPLLALVILAILVAVIVYRRWKKKRKGYEATDEAVPMHPVVGVPVS